jgi:pyruvate dehydrogenase E2 component (dihydrolipoamide acetyltransferase)
VEVVVPDLGDFADVEVIEVLVKPGDTVTAEQGLITHETDKATMDIPSPADGKLVAVKVKVGDRVSTGSVIATLEVAAAQLTAEPAVDPRPEDDRTVRQPKLARASAAPASAEPASAEPRLVTVPDLGDFSGVEIIDVLVKAGDEVAAEQGLVTLETEKASMDVPAPEAGKVLELKVGVGDKVSTGDPVLLLKPSAAAQAAGAPNAAQSASAPAPLARPATVAPAASPRAATRGAAATPASFGEAHASPSVRKLARELGVELGRVRGSGAKGRVTADDVKAFVKGAMQAGGGTSAALPAVPTVDFAKYGSVETEPLSRIQKIAGPRLHASWGRRARHPCLPLPSASDRSARPKRRAVQPTAVANAAPCSGARRRRRGKRTACRGPSARDAETSSRPVRPLGWSRRCPRAQGRDDRR